jgi:hypothetical protein
MDDFLHALATWGVAPFTVLLIAAVLYWLLVILGALDLDILHLHHEAHHDAAHDGHHAGDDQHPGWFAGFLEFLSVGKVPLTVILSILVFAGWTVAMLLALLGLWWLLVAPAALAVALPLTAAACRPLRAVFSSLDRGTATGVSLFGREARITSATCDANFGTATCEVDGAEHLIRVVAIRSDLVFRRNDPVVIADHDRERDVYLVGPADYLREPAAPRQAEPAAGLVTEPLAEPAASSPESSSTTESSQAPVRRPLSQ